MSKLNDLITKLCPCGVQYKPMWAITTWDKKFNGVDKKKQSAINRHHYYLAKELEPLIVPNGDIKVLTTSPSDLYTTAELAKGNIKDGEIVAIPWGGNAIVQYYNGKYITSDNRIAIVNDEKQLNCKFLYYVLKNKEKELAKYYRGAGIKHPDMFKVLHMEIPLPPLPVQSEIVRILDAFTELEAELEAELADRIEQYEYYRDHLLDKKNLERMDGGKVEHDTVDSLVDVITATAKIKKNEYKEIGIFPVIDQGMNTVIAGYTDNAKALPDNEWILFGDHTCSLKYFDGRFVQGADGLKILKAHDNVLPKFVFYALKNLNVSSNEYARHWTSFKKNELPVPSLATQKRVVDILDRFDALTTSLTDGIPAEIAMRREQYEYYRSRLLDFPRLPDDAVSDGE